MKQTIESQKTKNKSLNKGTIQTQKKSLQLSNNKEVNGESIRKNSINSKPDHKGGNPQEPKYKINAITKENFEISHKKQNITEIEELHLKYVLKCIEGLYKNRLLFITTHPEGEILGSGDAKLEGLTLQIEGVGLAPKHAQLRYDGFKSFNVKDFGSEGGTWMNIPKEGVEITDGDYYSVGQHLIRFEMGNKIDEIEEIFSLSNLDYLSDILKYNDIKTMADFYKIDNTNYEGYPFDKKDIDKMKKICTESKSWYQDTKKYHLWNMYFISEPLKEFSVQIGWKTHSIGENSESILNPKNPVADVIKGRLIPREKLYSKIKEGEEFPLSLHSQIKLGDLAFEMTRFNCGSGIDIGFRPAQEDGLIIEEDIGGSEWKLISLFAVFDGHGGKECMEFMCENLVSKVREWSHLLDSAGDVNEMTKLLMSKTFYELDHAFHQKYPEISSSCGTTALVVLIIEKRVYCFHVGDCKSYLLRKDVLYQMNIDHLPTRGDERLRIENVGGFIQYDRLMGKCILSRCLGQFEYKAIEDYENQFKGKQKSLLSCIPDMTTFDLQVENDDFILLTTDGILAYMTIQEITDFIMERYDKLETEENPSKIISSLMENCKILSPECDNMAAILIIIRKGSVTN